MEGDAESHTAQEGSHAKEEEANRAAARTRDFILGQGIEDGVWFGCVKEDRRVSRAPSLWMCT